MEQILSKSVFLKAFSAVGPLKLRYKLNYVFLRGWKKSSGCTYSLQKCSSERESPKLVLVLTFRSVTLCLLDTEADHLVLH